MSSIKTYQNVNRVIRSRALEYPAQRIFTISMQGKQTPLIAMIFIPSSFAAEAKGQHIIDFKEYTLGERQVYFIGPGQVHQS